MPQFQIDILYVLTLQTALGEFRLRERCTSIWEVQAIIRGHAKIEPICLPQLRQITNTKQYRLPGRQEKVTKTVQELERVGSLDLHTAYITSPYGQSESHMVRGE